MISEVSAFADSVRPSRRVILRLPMLDYSIGHELILIRERNPLIMPVENVTDEQYRVAILRSAMVCSRTWRENQTAFRWFRLWRWFARRQDFALAIADWHNYRIAGTTMPEVQPMPGERGRSLGAPHLARLLDYGMKLCGQQAFDLPFGLLNWLYYASAEAEGSCIVESEGEKATREIVAAMEAEIRKEKEAPCPA